jgi:hypothetical protein
MPFLLARGDQVLVSSFLTGNAALDPGRDFLFAPDHVQYPGGWSLGWQQGSECISLTLTTRHVLEKTDLLQDRRPLVRKVIDALVAHPYYVRCVTDVEGELALDGDASWVSGGRAICEQMVLRVPRKPDRKGAS